MATCGDKHPNVGTLPCDQPAGHDGNHSSYDGMFWSPTTPPPSDPTLAAMVPIVSQAVREAFWRTLVENPDPLGAYAHAQSGLVDGYMPQDLFDQVAAQVVAALQEYI